MSERESRGKSTRQKSKSVAFLFFLPFFRLLALEGRIEVIENEARHCKTDGGIVLEREDRWDGDDDDDGKGRNTHTHTR
jgi:hypothetical protein